MIYTKENYKNAKPNDEFEFICEKCGKKFIRTKRYIQKNKGIVPKCCSTECGRRNKDKGEIEVTCANCGKSFVIKTSDYEKRLRNGKNIFCSSSCAATFNNKIYHKKEIIYVNKNKKDVCPHCGNFKNAKSELCQTCANELKRNTGNKELGYYIGYDKDRKKYLSGKCQQIRKDAKRVLEEDKEIEKVCAYCHNHEFDDILEVHHIKGILDFDAHTLIKEINKSNNLVWLCPNHHTMLEKGMITLE